MVKSKYSIKIRLSRRFVFSFFVVTLAIISFLLYSGAQSKVYAGCSGSCGACSASCNDDEDEVSSGGTTRCCWDGSCETDGSGCHTASNPSCGNCVHCVPHCTPATSCSCNCGCPTGTSTTPTGPLCRFTKHCNACSLGCGQTQDCDDKTCYNPETNNSVPAAPLATYICINHTSNCTQLSTNASAPTIIPQPAASDQVFIVMYPSTMPAGARSLRYALRVDNTTASPTFNGTCSPNYAGDVCTGWLTTNSSGDLNSQLAFAGGSYYHVWAHEGTLNVCDDNVKTDWSAIHGYFKINRAPTIVSLTPNSGISGNETGLHGPASVCSVNNPTSYTATYRDLDGCSDIGWGALWADDATPLATNLDTLHAAVRKGTLLKVYAAPSTSGTCASTNPVMQIIVNGAVVKSYIVGSNAFYKYFSSTPISPGQVTIQLGNDCWGGTGNDTNLTVSRISLNGYSYFANASGTQFCRNSSCSTSAGTTLSNTWDSFKFAGNTTYGSSDYKTYGLAYSSDDADPNCGGLTGPACDRNYEWSVPGPNGGTLGTYISSPSIATSYTDVGGVNAASKVRWTAASATCINATDLQVVYNVGYQGDIGYNLNLYAYVRDHQEAAAGWTDFGDWTLDLIAPSTTVNPTVTSKTTYGVTWTASDVGIGLLQSYGTAALLNTENLTPWYANEKKSIKNLGNNVSVALPVLAGDHYSPTHLWGYTSTGSATENINIGTIDNGQLKFKVNAIDKACNMGFGDNAAMIGSTWLITKAGVVYSGGEVIDNVVDFGTDPTKGYGLLPNPTTYSWGVTSPFQYSLTIDKSQTQISTELLSIAGTTANKLISRTDTTYKPYLVKSYSDANNTSYYQKLKEQYSAKLITSYTPVSLASGVSLSGRVSSSCSDATKKCAIDAVGDLTINSGFICDRETVVFVGGNLTLTPNITFDPANPKYGCIFVVKGNALFKDGTNQSASSSYPLYDLFQLFVIADGQVTFERSLDTEIISDGIKIDGSVIALGNSTPSIRWQRSLQLSNNNTFPSVAINLDPRYLFMAPDFFEGNFDAYVKELGFKPY